jgi:hypothetical protein
MNRFQRALVAAQPDPAKLQLWADALKDPSYTQIPGDLRRGPPAARCMCVMGVAVDVLAPELWNDNFGNSCLALEDENTSYGRLQQVLGARHPISPGPIYQESDAGTPFPELANFIEEVIPQCASKS